MRLEGQLAGRGVEDAGFRLVTFPSQKSGPDQLLQQIFLSFRWAENRESTFAVREISAEIEKSRSIAQSLGVKLRVRAFIDS